MATAAVPMGVLAWIVAPWLRDQLGGDEPLAQALVIAEGINVVFVSPQLGHANPITLEVYAHLFERADHAESARDAIEASHAAMTSSR